MAEHAITTALKKMWTPIHQERLVGIGYAIPWLDRFSPDAERTINIMPPKLGAVRWPAAQKNATVVAEEENIPLPDSSIDRVLVVHGFEKFQNPPVALQEVWRVLTPAGKLIIVTPNKNSLMTKIKNNPFAKNKSFAKNQIRVWLSEAMYQVESYSTILYCPLTNRLTKYAQQCETFGRRWIKIGGGLVVIEAQKKTIAGVTVKNVRTKNLFVGNLKPQGTARIHNPKI